MRVELIALRSLREGGSPARIFDVVGGNRGWYNTSKIPRPTGAPK